MPRLLLGILVLVALTLMCSSSGEQVCKRPVLSKNLSIAKIRHKKRNRGNAFVAGSKIFFKCKKGFLLFGKDKIKCQKNGLWTHDPPSCAGISRKKTKNTKKTTRCPMPEPVFNGAVTASRRVSSTASYRCIKGYEVIGPKERKCLPSGKWAGTSPKCVKISCPDPGVPENGRRTGNKFDHGDRVRYSCLSGYTLSGSAVRKCKENQRWSGLPAVCKATSCPDPGVPENGRRTGNKFDHGDRVRYSCLSGYALSGSAVRKCKKNQRWSGLPAVCKATSCPDPGVPENGRRAGNKFDHGDRVRYSCLSGYTLSGSAVRKCKKNQRWSGLPAVCKATSCPYPGVPENGRRAGNKFDHGDRVRYSCLSGYTLSGSAVRQCKKNQRWSGLPAVCKDYSKCGQGGVISRGRIMGGNISRSINGTQWPWQVAIYRFGLKYHEFHCSGSLISNNLILTAAQCTYDFRSHSTEINPNRYRVVVGELKIILEPSDEAEMWLEEKAFRVKRVHVHKEFNLDVFSNDIAILEFRSPVKWSAKVQPVCLPETHHNVEEKFYGYATGWGNTANIAKGERQKKSEDLRYVFLPVQSNKTCKLKDARKNKMFCAGYATEDKDACRGDSGGPFVVKYADDERETQFSFKIMGIVSHGPECGTKDEFGFYTRVTNYLGWIKKTIAEMKKGD